MRVLVVVPEFPALSETFIMRQVLGLEATVCAFKINRSLPIPKGITVVEMPEQHLPPRLYRYARAVARMLLGHGPYDLEPAQKRAFLDCLHAHRPDVVLAQYGPMGIRVSRACQSLGIPLVVHFHGHDATAAPRSRRYRWGLRELFDHASAVVVASKYIKGKLLCLGCAREKITIIPCGVSLQSFVPSTGVAKQPCRFLAVGRFVEKKSPLDTIRALSICAKEHPNASLTMIGDGVLLEPAKNLVVSLGIADRVTFLGAQPNEVVKRYMRNSAVFVQHSRTASDGDEEGWGVVFAEASASCLPIVTTNHGPIPEVVLHGKTGFLCNVADIETMAHYMSILAGDPALRVRMGLQGREYMADYGDLSSRVDELYQVLLRVAQSRRGTRASPSR